MGLLVLLFLDLASLPAARAAGPAADDLAIYQRALADVARREHVIIDETASERCRKTAGGSAQVRQDTASSYLERNRRSPKLSSLISPRQLPGFAVSGTGDIDQPVQKVGLSAIGWSQDRNQAWLQLDTDDSGAYCLLYRRVGVTFRLQSEIRVQGSR